MKTSFGGCRSTRILVSLTLHPPRKCLTLDRYSQHDVEIEISGQDRGGTMNHSVSTNRVSFDYHLIIQSFFYLIDRIVGVSPCHPRARTDTAVLIQHSCAAQRGDRDQRAGPGGDHDRPHVPPQARLRLENYYIIMKLLQKLLHNEKVSS